MAQKLKRYQPTPKPEQPAKPAPPVVTIIADEVIDPDVVEIDPGITLELSRHHGRGPIELHPDPCYACVKDSMKMLNLDRVRLEEDEDEDAEYESDAKRLRARRKRQARMERNRQILLEAATYLARATCWHNRLEAERPKPGSKLQRWACRCGALDPLPTRCDIRLVRCSSSASSSVHRPKELAEPFDPAECCPPFRVLPTSCTDASVACRSTETTAHLESKVREATRGLIDCHYRRPDTCVTGESCGLAGSVHVRPVASPSAIDVIDCFHVTPESCSTESSDCRREPSAHRTDVAEGPRDAVCAPPTTALPVKTWKIPAWNDRQGWDSIADHLTAKQPSSTLPQRPCAHVRERSQATDHKVADRHVMPVR